MSFNQNLQNYKNNALLKKFKYIINYEVQTIYSVISLVVNYWTKKERHFLNFNIFDEYISLSVTQS